MYNLNFKITDLNCDACVKLSLSALKRIEGITSVKIDQKSGSAEILAEKNIAWDDIVNALAFVNKHAQLS